MNYEALLDEAQQDGLIVKEKPLIYNDGRIKGKRIAIRKDIETSKEKACVLAEELGHHHTSIGNIIDMENVSNRKQERQARIWGYNKLIGLTGIIKAFEAGCQSVHDIAEFLEVTEEYFLDAIECYRGKYGVSTEISEYTIYFIPYLTVLKRI